MKYNNLFRLLSSIIICELAGFIGSIFTTPQIGVPLRSWYEGLNKPFFNPPNWVFGPVWTAIFILMGISLYLVWLKKWEPKNNGSDNKVNMWNSLSQKFLSGSWRRVNLILIFTLQLILNVSWQIIFFGAHSIGVAFFELLMLWFAIIFTIVNFCRVSKIAALLLLPYILWVSFAGILNCFIWLLN